MDFKIIICMFLVYSVSSQAQQKCLSFQQKKRLSQVFQTTLDPKYISAYVDNKIIFFDTDTFETIELPHNAEGSIWTPYNGKFYQTQRNLNGTSVDETDTLSAVKQFNTLVYDPKTKKTETINSTIMIPGHYKYKITVNSENKLQIENYVNKNILLFNKMAKVGTDESTDFSDDAMYTYNKSTNTISKYDTDGNKSEVFKLPVVFASNSNSDNSMTVLPTKPTSFAIGNFRYWIDEKNKSEIKHDSVSRNGSEIIYSSSNANGNTETTFYNTSTGQLAVLPKTDPNFINKIDRINDTICIQGDMQYSVDLKTSITRTGTSTNCINLKNNKYTVTMPTLEFMLQLPLNEGTTIVRFANNDNYNSYLLKDGKLCSDKKYNVTCDCLTMSDEQKNEVLKKLFDTQFELACKSNYTEEFWNKVNDINKTNMNEEDAVKWMAQFSKPNGFDIHKHHGVLAAILKSNMLGLVQDELSITAKYITDKYPDYFKQNFPNLVIPKNANIPRCMSTSEKEKIALDMLNKAKSEINGFYNADDIKNYVNNNSSLFTKYMSAPQRDDLAHYYGDKMVEHARNIDEYKGVFPSKTFRFSYNSALKKLGLNSLNLTDVTTVKVTQYDKTSRLKILMMSSEVCKNCNESPFGFYTKELASLDKSKLADESQLAFKFSSGGKNFKTDIKISPVDVEEPIDKSPSPNYPELWKDNTFRGLIITNEPSKEGVFTTDSYIAYYRRNGYEFKEPPQVVDTKELLKSRTLGDMQSDYLVKEAHSDGDEKNLFRIPLQSKLMKGIKQLPEGKVEEIEILVPAEGSKSELLSNTEFANWMGERVNKGGGQLLYLNSSCNSYTKASYEIPAVAAVSKEAAKKFVNIASNSLVYFFRDQNARHVDDKNNVKRYILDGFRSGKSYQEIRETMKQDSRYREKRANLFVFPDDDNDYAPVLSNLDMPVLIDPKMEVQNPDGSWSKYNLDQNWNE